MNRALLETCRAILDDSPTGYAAPRAERAWIDASCGKGAAVYGEVTHDGALRLFQALRLGPDDVFYDLGSGIGTLPLLAAVATPVGRAVGVELSSYRHGVAAQNLARLAATTNVDRRVELRLGDLRFTDIADATVIFAGATLFPDPLLRALCRRVETDATRLHTLVCTRELPPPFDRVFPARGGLDVATTWSPRVRAVFHDAPPAHRLPRTDRQFA